MGSRVSRVRQEEEEEGSRREQGPAPGEPLLPAYTALLLTDSCPLLSLSSGPLELLLSLLPLPQLASLASSCSQLNDAVGEFLRHEVSQHRLTSVLKAFLEMNRQLLTQEEAVEVGGLGQQGEGRRRQYRLLARRRHYQQQVRRVSCCQDQVWIPHRENSSYMRIRQEEELGRGVVEVRTVCWLQVSHTWPHVSQGRWEVALRLKLLPRFAWPHQEQHMSSWQVRWSGGAGEEREEVRVGRQWWRMLQQASTPRSVGRGLRVEAEVVGGQTTGWLKVSLPSFTMLTTGKVAFEFKDVECPFWKGGISFDFIELKRLG